VQGVERQPRQEERSGFQQKTVKFVEELGDSQGDYQQRELLLRELL
jgi:hypothetical protein